MLWGETGLTFFFLSPLFYGFAAIYGHADDKFLMIYQKKKKKRKKNSWWQ